MKFCESIIMKILSVRSSHTWYRSYNYLMPPKGAGVRGKVARGLSHFRADILRFDRTPNFSESVLVKLAVRTTNILDTDCTLIHL
jgi:hypothetical protein